MADQFNSFEAFIQSINGSLTTISNNLATIAAGLNPDGMTAAEVQQLQTDLSGVANAAQALATSSTQIAGAGQGSVPGTGSVPEGTGTGE